MTASPRQEQFARWAPSLVLLGLVALFTAVNPDFLSLANFARISIVAAPALLVSLGVAFVIVMGSIDLSMEGTIATTAVVFGLAFMGLGGTLAPWGWLAIPLTLATGAVLGWVNGMIHVRLRIPSFMSSLALGFIGIGIALVLTGGDRIRIEDETFRMLLTERLGGFPLMAYVALGLVLLAWFVMQRTTVGRNFYAVGGGEDLAHASGLDVGRVRVVAFSLAGLFYAAAAVVAVARLGIAETATGLNYMFISITAVVVGGTSLMGGSGGVWNTVVGVLIVNVIGNGMVVVGLPRYLQDGVLGLLIIAAVALATQRRVATLVK
jgi:ribose transport system permease protein